MKNWFVVKLSKFNYFYGNKMFFSEKFLWWHKGNVIFLKSALEVLYLSTFLVFVFEDLAKIFNLFFDIFKFLYESERRVSFTKRKYVNYMISNIRRES